MEEFNTFCEQSNLLYVMRLRFFIYDYVASIGGYVSSQWAKIVQRPWFIISYIYNLQIINSNNPKTLHYVIIESLVFRFTSLHTKNTKRLNLYTSNL